MQKDTRRVSMAGLAPSDEYKHFHPSADSGQAAGLGSFFRATQTEDASLNLAPAPRGVDVPSFSATSAFHLLLGESEAIKETLARMREEELIIADELAVEEARSLLRVREAESLAMRRVQEAWNERLQAIEDERTVLLGDEQELQEERDKLHSMHMDAARLHGRRTSDLLAAGNVIKQHHSRVLAERRLLLGHGVRLNSTLNQVADLIRRPPLNEPRINLSVLASQPERLRLQMSYAFPLPHRDTAGDEPHTQASQPPPQRQRNRPLKTPGTEHLQIQLNEYEALEKSIDDAFDIKELHEGGARHGRGLGVGKKGGAGVGKPQNAKRGPSPDTKGQTKPVHVGATIPSKFPHRPFR